jgi:predicted metal-binding membrane protein
MDPHRPTALEGALRNTPRFAVGSLLVLSLLCWAWLAPVALDMSGSMRGPSAWMMTARWDAPYTLMMAAMWLVMMTAMMLPSALPTVLLFGWVVRSDAAASPTVRVYVFAAGYLIVWGAFAVAMTFVQRELSLRAVMTAMMQLETYRWSGALVVLAGLYELTPLKRACLRACQSPAGFIARNWRTGNLGALRLGVGHGLYCLGCCWALMLLLFVGGVMNLYVIAALSTVVAVEKTSRLGELGSRVSGGVLVALAIWILRS